MAAEPRTPTLGGSDQPANVLDAAPPKSRYRLEDGQPILDVRVESMEQLFDNRDPAPFRDRDLDPGLVEYLLDAARDLAHARPLRVEIWLGSSPLGDVPHAVREYFQHEIDRTNRHRREQVRAGSNTPTICTTGAGGFEPPTS